MSYQVLARKWRPAQFSEVVGQAHIVSALSNALEQNRVHHAFLFTGTRGVGKTTLARIFAKALNCEQGVSAHPCGQCASCVAVAEGRFIDLIEVDAASRTRVDDTRELLENVQYAPTQGRYKVYLIDEVHMLSTHSFNALLKTLEEPPEHVKFLLATTDPQKLPMTVLSRCIQFSLNAIEPQAIETQLSTILDSEKIPYEKPALTLLARAADGSLRDALSLLDQGIAFSNQQLSEQSVRDMLGLVDSQIIVAMLDALAVQDMQALMDGVEHLIHAAQDLKAALDDLLSWLHTLALYQFSPEAIEWKGLNSVEVARLAQSYSPQSIQLFYQIALNGKRDFALAPDPRTGFEMVLLRLMAFKPDDARGKKDQTPGLAPGSSFEPQPKGVAVADIPVESEALAKAQAPADADNRGTAVVSDTAYTSDASVPADPDVPAGAMLSVAEAPADFLENGLQNAELQRLLKPASSIAAPPAPVAEADESDGLAIPGDKLNQAVGEPGCLAGKPGGTLSETPVETISQVSEVLEIPSSASTFLPKEMIEIKSLIDNINVWADFVIKIGLSGMARQLVVQMTPLAFKNGVLYLRLDSRYRNLQSESRTAQICDALQTGSGQKFKLDIDFGEVLLNQTAAGVIAERERNQLEKTRQDFNNDENVQAMASLFDAQLDDNSIKSLDS